jgi:hypothetical protein
VTVLTASVTQVTVLTASVTQVTVAGLTQHIITNSQNVVANINIGTMPQLNLIAPHYTTV